MREILVGVLCSILSLSLLPAASGASVEPAAYDDSVVIARGSTVDVDVLANDVRSPGATVSLTSSYFYRSGVSLEVVANKVRISVQPTAEAGFFSFEYKLNDVPSRWSLIGQVSVRVTSEDPEPVSTTYCETARVAFYAPRMKVRLPGGVYRVKQFTLLPGQSYKMLRPRCSDVLPPASKVTAARALGDQAFRIPGVTNGQLRATPKGAYEWRVTRSWERRQALSDGSSEVEVVQTWHSQSIYRWNGRKIRVTDRG